MKKTLLMCFFMCITLLVSAQQFSFGVNSSIYDINLSSFNRNVKDFYITEFRSNFVGLNFKYYPNQYTYYTNNITGISGGVGISTFKMKMNNSSYSYESVINSLECPLLVHHKNEDWGLYIEAGPSYIYNYKISYNDLPSKPINKNTLNGVFGIGFDNRLTNDLKFTIGTRFSYNLTDLTNNSNGLIGYKSTHYIRTQMMLGVSYYIENYHDNH